MTMHRRELLLATLLAGVLAPVRAAAPALRFSAAARERALAMLDGRGPDAVLLLVLGDYEWRGADGGSERRHGWILQALAPTRVPGRAAVAIDGLPVVAPQTHLYGELCFKGSDPLKWCGAARPVADL